MSKAMSLETKKLFYKEIISSPAYHSIISSLDFDNTTGNGKITYNPTGVSVNPGTVGFVGTTTELHDEEWVRALILLRLVTHYGYAADADILEIEKVYENPGRPKKDSKGGRVDIVVYKKGSKEVFLFIECKTPSTYEMDRKYIKGQLFQLSKLETVRPPHLIYYTCDISGEDGSVNERITTISTKEYSEYEQWDSAGQPAKNSIPVKYGTPIKKRYANIRKSTKERLPLSVENNEIFFAALQGQIHDVIWGGGGTASNEVFAYISRLLLCKIYDEKETKPRQDFQVQRLENETAEQLVARLNQIYKVAETAYLALPVSSENVAFDPARIAPSKIAYVVERIESVSFIENALDGDLLGGFFEQIVATDFTQTKGQFFTPNIIIQFMFKLIDITSNAKVIFENEHDRLGRRRLPYVIDPSCGSGAFLIEYMKEISKSLNTQEYRESLSKRQLEAYQTFFSGPTGNAWARDYLFAVECNYDLGLAAKVNMVLHGDGSMNTWISNGLLPFEKYRIEGRNNILGASQAINKEHPYQYSLNEQFDLVISNPPFSITMSEDEKNDIEAAFSGLLNLSENLFIERWYQLLRENGQFCCVLPESVLDTKTNKAVRIFLLTHFKILAAVSLPYDAFKPFTSTKTCILYAQKRTAEQVKAIQERYNSIIINNKPISSEKALRQAFSELDLGDEEIFMAEPCSIGYKRRKGLSDLSTKNDLYSDTNPENTVLYHFKNRRTLNSDDKLGFITTVDNVLSRDSIRLDPKYRWLWDFQHGVIGKNEERAVPLSKYFEYCALQKLKSGELDAETLLVDLDCVQARSGEIIANCEEVTSIQSDKVCFEGADLLISKLEPYLGKVVIDPPQNAIGTTEWIGLKCKTGLDHRVAGYFLMLPQMCDGYRRLQSGKRHARMEAEELLELKVDCDLEMIPPIDVKKLDFEISQGKAKIQALREKVDQLIMPKA